MHHLRGENQEEHVSVSLIGDKDFKGVIFDSGKDIIVLFNGEEFIYIPISHIESIVQENPDTGYTQPTDVSNINFIQLEKDLSFEDILIEAKGIFQEFCVLTRKPLHGTILEVLDDYIVFYSPIYKNVYIPKAHVKWIIPFTPNNRPYGLAESQVNGHGSCRKFKDNFEEQLNMLINKLVILNLGDKSYHTGKILSISHQMVELQTAKKKSIYINTEHIQTIHEV